VRRGVADCASRASGPLSRVARACFRVFGGWRVGLLRDEVVAAPEPRVVALNVSATFSEKGQVR
jgi:hypothetical protein